MPETQTWPFLLAVGLKFLGHRERLFLAKHFLGDEVGSPSMCTELRLPSLFFLKVKD